MTGRRRTALCHEWITAYGGSEQVASRLAEIFDVDDVFTFAAEPSLARRLFPGRRVHATPLGESSFARRHWQWMVPVMSRAWAAIDLSAYDLVVTSSHSCVNSIRTRPDAVHVSYCHTPMRYAWDWRMELGRLPTPIRPAWPVMAGVLRRADRGRVRSVTAFIANSHHVASRIRRFYGRDAAVVPPPVDTTFWTPDARPGREDFFLLAGRLVAYKRPDVAVRAAELAGVDLVVAGDGPELGRLRRIAGSRTTFVVAPPRDALRDLYRRCRAVVNPGVEDFGMTMAEAQACGAPVIALGAGGAREIVVDGRTGVLYHDPSPEGLRDSMRTFRDGAFHPEAAASNAQRFALDRFDEDIRAVVDDVVRRSRGRRETGIPRLAPAGTGSPR